MRSARGVLVDGDEAADRPNRARTARFTSKAQQPFLGTHG